MLWTKVEGGLIELERIGWAFMRNEVSSQQDVYKWASKIREHHEAINVVIPSKIWGLKYDAIGNRAK